MAEPWVQDLLAATAADRLERGARIQSLWSGYGEIFRARLHGRGVRDVVIKRVEPPTERTHPRGWTSTLGHARKLRSYDVELAFYRSWSPQLPPEVRVARCLAAGRASEGWWFAFEDLDRAGFSARRATAGPEEIHTCLRWLAGFHAAFLGEAPEGLWPVGTYWHLATRPEELAAIDDLELVRAAPLLDARLSACRYPTVVHGDAKLANFCFAPEGAVAGVDFQYAGGGPGVKDVAYFLSSVRERPSEEDEIYVAGYFSALREALLRREETFDLEAIEAEGRALLPLAWADFHRFLAGWAPDHWKLDASLRAQTRVVLDSLFQ